MEIKTMEAQVESKRTPLPRLSPWLVYKHGKKDQGQIFCSLMESGAMKISRKYIPELRNKEIVGCSYGWVILLLRNSNGEGMHYSLWNPITSESFNLPSLHLKPKQFIWYCLLTDSPSHKDSKILLFCNVHSIIYCQFSHKKWIEIKYFNQVKSLKHEEQSEYVLIKPVSCNGKIYATSSSFGHLLLIEFDRSDSLKVSFQTYLPRSRHLHFPRVGDYLVESIGELFCISFQFGGVKWEEITLVEVFKLEFSSMTWAKVTSAKDRAFFLGKDYGMSCPILSSDIEGRRIYFTRKNDRSLYSYNMEDQSILVSLPCLDLPTPFEARPHWIMPDLRLVNEEEKMELEPDEEEKDVQVSGRESTGKETEDPRMNLLDLPWLVLDTIARHLILVDYMNFRAVSKLCSKIAPPICWRTELAGLKTSQLLSPWLIFPESDKCIYHLVDSRQNNNRCFLKIPHLVQDTVIRCSKEGWLLMSNHFSVTLFNPFTKNTIQLPDVPPEAGFGIRTLSLTCSPSSPNCYIVGLAQCHTLLAVSIISPGQNEWQVVSGEAKPLAGVFNPGAFYQGCFYFLNQAGMLEVADISSSKGLIDWKSLDKPIPPCINFQHNYLVECDNELVAVFVGKMGESVKVYRLNFAEFFWEEIRSLRNYVLYLSRSSSFSARVKIPEIANRIYFPQFHNQNIVFYSLNTGKFHALGTEYSFKSWYRTAQQTDCAWIEPSWC